MGQKSSRRNPKNRISESLPDLRAPNISADEIRISLSVPNLQKIEFIERLKNPTLKDDYAKLKHDLACSSECINKRSEFVMLSQEDIRDRINHVSDDWECPICMDTPPQMFLTRCIHLVCHECTYDLIEKYGEHNKIHFLCPMCMGLASKFDLNDILNPHLSREIYVSA